MSNKLKKKYKNEHVFVKGLYYTNMTPIYMKYECICTNDEIGKTLSIAIDSTHMITIPFEPLEKCFTS